MAIKIKEKLCSCGCGKIGRIWSKGMLKECSMRLNPPKKIQYKSAKQKIKDVDKAKRTQELHQWFLQIWNKRRERDELDYFVRCFETGQKLYEKYFKYNTCCYHHLIEKSTHPEYEFEEENLVIIHPDIHTLTHNDIDKTPKLKELKKKFNIELTKENLSLTKEN
jgi:hypothetical protein